MRNGEVWIFIFLLGLLGFNWPMIEVFYAEVALYLFVFWLLFIALTAIVAHKYGARNATAGTAGEERTVPADEGGDGRSSSPDLRPSSLP